MFELWIQHFASEKSKTLIQFNKVKPKPEAEIHLHSLPTNETDQNVQKVVT